MNGEIEIDGNDAECENIVLQNAENKNPLRLINFTREMVPFCHAVAEKHGYELKGKIPPTETGVCYFIPNNYDRSKITTLDVISGSPND